jgi:hypothetical protein
MLTFVFFDSQTGNQFARIGGYLVSVNARCTPESTVRYTANGGEMHSHCRIIDRRWTVDESSPECMSDDELRANASF